MTHDHEEYMETVDRIEPDIHPIDTNEGWASLAISLKRIADAIESAFHVPGTHLGKPGKVSLVPGKADVEEKTLVRTIPVARCHRKENIFAIEWTQEAKAVLFAFNGVGPRNAPIWLIDAFHEGHLLIGDGGGLMMYGRPVDWGDWIVGELKRGRPFSVTAKQFADRYDFERIVPDENHD